MFDLDSLNFKQFDIKDAIHGLPAPDELDYLWTNENLVNLLQNQSADNHLYLFKYGELFLELSYLLNEGYLLFREEAYDVPLFKKLDLYFSSKEEVLAHIDAPLIPMYQAIWDYSKYLNEVFMSLSLASRLYKTGAYDIVFNKRNYSIYSKARGIMIKHGNVGIPYLLNSFEKGLNEFIITPHIQNDKGIMYILSVTPKYKDYLANKHRKIQLEKRAFNKIKGKYIPSYSVYNNELLVAGDLVAFKTNETIKRGYVLDHFELGKINYIEYVEYLHKSIQPTFDVNMQLQEMFGLYHLGVECMFDENDYKEADFIIRCLERNARSEKHTFYAVKKEAIQSYLSWEHNIELFHSFKDVLRQGKMMNPSVAFEAEQDDSSDANATYDPMTHTINFNKDRMLISSYSSYALDNIHPADFFSSVLAHELGHADPRGLHVFKNLDFEIFNESNRLSKRIKENIDSIEYSSELPDISLIKKIVELCQKQVSYLERHYEYVITSEFNAYLYGMDYLHDDNLKRLFQVKNKEMYFNYKKVELKLLRTAQQQLYVMKRLLTKLQ